MKLEANGVQLNVEIEGQEGAPWITLSHSLACNLSMWDEQVGILRERFRVLRYDLRGHGGSSAPNGPYTFAMLESDVVALWNTLKIEKSHWLGLSIGAMIGYGLAIEHGDRLLSLMACDGRSDAPPDYQAFFQQRIEVARTGGMAALAGPTIERWFKPENLAANPPEIAKLRRMIESTDVVGHEGCCEALKGLAFGSRLGTIRVPTLIVGGDSDLSAAPEMLARVAKNIPGARHAVIPNAGHISNMENATAFNQVMRTFFS
jgi:3-oxoadipate enol-lactonase